MLVGQVAQLGGNAIVPLVKDVHVGLEDGDVRPGRIRDAQHLLHRRNVRRHRQVGPLARHQLQQLPAGCVLTQGRALLEWQPAPMRPRFMAVQPFALGCVPVNNSLSTSLVHEA